MIRRLIAVLATLICCLCLSLTSNAQTNPNLEIGLKPYGSFEGGNIDSINLTNGNLSIKIPLFSYPQRGSFPANLHLSYNNKNWYVFQWCQNAICHDQWRWRWQTTQGVFLNADGGVGVTYAPLIPGQNSVYVFTATTSDGASHMMVPNNAGGYETADGTGIWYNGYTAGNPGGPVIRTRDGSQPLAEDANGNLVSSVVPGPNYPFASISTDTLGRGLNPSGTSTTDYSGCVQPASPTQISSALIYNYPGQNGSNRMIKTCSANYTLNTNFQAYDANAGVPIQEGTKSVAFIVSVVLYNGSSWSTSPAWGFDYISRNAGDPSTVNYGDLSSITLPTGGTISYTWGTTDLCTSSSSLTQVSRAVTARTVDAKDGTGPQTWTYSINYGFGAGTAFIWGAVVTDPDGNQTVHGMTEYGSCGYYEIGAQWFKGKYATGGTLLKTVKTDYISQQNPYSAHMDPALPVNVLPIRTTTVWPNGKTTKVERDYDSNLKSNTYSYSYGDVVATREYDYGNNAPGGLLRTTTNAYLPFSNSSYLTANLLDLVSSTTVTDGSGTQMAQTTYAYDGYSLQSGGIATQRDANFNSTSPGIRGNRTSLCRWLNTTGGNLCATTKYYDTGMPYQVTDANGNTTTHSYSSTYAGAYVTQTNLPDTGSPAVHHVISGTYDFNTGQLMSFTDQNGNVSNYTFDALGRITSGSFPDGGQTSFTYTDSALNSSVERTQKTTSAISTDLLVEFDGLARKKQTQLKSDPIGIVYADFTYL